MRPVFADPKTDFVFKRIFGSEEHKVSILGLLNGLLELDGSRRIVDVKLLAPEQAPAVQELKLSIVDMKCRDARGVTYVVEMQVLNVDGFEKRVVYNVAKAYVAQLGKARPYPQLDDVIGVTIADFELWPGSDGFHVPMLSRWQMQEQHTGATGLRQLQFVFLELPKYDQARPPATMPEKWAYFFREAGDLTMVPEVLSEPPFADALEGARTAGFTEAEWELYMAAEISLQSERAMFDAADKGGEARGLAKGLVKAVEAAFELLGIELSADRRASLGRLNAGDLDALLAKLQANRRWD